MKKMKKAASLLLAMIMVLSMTIAAFAAYENQGTITINGTEAGKTYDLYRIFDITMTSEDPASATYAIATKWTNFFGEGGAGNSYITDVDSDDGLIELDDGQYINITEANVEAFAKAALNYALATPVAADTSVAADEEIEIVDNLALGYYMIFPQGASTDDGYATLTSTAPKAIVTIKATYPTIEKEDDKDDEVGVEIGEVITYTITGKVPNTTAYTGGYTYLIEDTMSAGLTFKNDVTVTVDGNALDADDYTYTPNVENNSFTLKIEVADLQANVGDEIVVTYTAVVNDAAAAAISKNSATLTYTTDAEGNTEKSASVETAVFSTKIVIDKTNGAGTKLSGAQFVLKNADGKFYKYTAAGDTNPAAVTWVNAQIDATVVTTDVNGAATFAGLKDGEYTLVETKAPDTYNIAKDIPVIVIDGNTDETDEKGLGDLTYTTEVINKSGSLLPETGGIGTTIFYIAGGALLLTGFVLIVARKRMKVEE